MNSNRLPIIVASEDRYEGPSLANAAQPYSGPRECKRGVLPCLARMLIIMAVLIPILGQHAHATSVTATPVNDLVAGGPAGDGSFSTIIREPDGVTVTVHTNTEPGAYTMWVLIWNDPSRCTNGGSPNCLPPPAGGNDIPDTVVFGTGQVVPSSGKGDFTAHIGLGETSGIIGGIERAGLTNPLGADIHAVLRIHGPVIPGALEGQITTVGGGCDVQECADVQAAVHEGGVQDADSMTLQQLLSLVRRISSAHGVLRRGE